MKARAARPRDKAVSVRTHRMCAMSVRTVPSCTDATLIGLVVSPTGHQRDTAAFIIDQLVAAQCSILVMQSALAYQPIIDTLHMKHAAGVNVTILVDNTVMERDRRLPLQKSSALRLSHLNQSWGMRSTSDDSLSRGSKRKSFLFHHKTFIIDGRVVCLGSANLFEEALSSFDEDYACFCNELLSKRFTAFFQRRWLARGWRVPEPTPADAAIGACNLHMAFTPTPSSSAHSSPRNSFARRQGYYPGTALAAARPAVTSALACVGERVELLEGPFFGPECRIDDVWTRYIHTARRRIRLAHYKVAWPPLVDSLAQAAARGVKVSVFTGTMTYVGRLNKSSLVHNIQWYQFRPAAEKGSLSKLFHHKIMLVDDDVVLMGSCNAMATSLRADSEDLTVFRSECMSKRIDQMCETHAQFERAQMVPCIDSRPRSGNLLKSVASSFSTRQAKLQHRRDRMAVTICSNGSL